MSGIGKGISVASLARILKSKGFTATCVKIDPYLNVDAGTMNPIEHGEVFVTEDGMETDQDLGNYERFLGENILASNYMTSGSVYLSVIGKERGLNMTGLACRLSRIFRTKLSGGFRLWREGRKQILFWWK